MLRLAMMGVGWAGTRQTEAVRELGGAVEVDCLVDSDAEFLAAKSRELGVSKTYTDYRKALADGDVDAVSICLPHVLHCRVACEAAGAGKHVLVEKPMAMTVDEATEMLSAAEEHGVRLFVAENLPYSPAARLLRRLVREEASVGEVIAASWTSGYRAPDYGYPGRRAHLSSPESGGMWTLQGIHSMAMLRHVLGEVESVYMREHHAGSFGRDDLEGTMTGLLTMAGGFTVHVTQSCELRLPADFARYVVHGDRGILRAGRERCELVRLDDAGDELDPERPEYPAGGPSEYALEIEAFAEYVAGGEAGEGRPTTGESERRSVAVVQAGYESAASGAEVVLKERFGEI